MTGAEVGETVISVSDNTSFLDKVRVHAPVYAGVVDSVLAKSPVQGKTLLPFLASMDDDYWHHAEDAAVVIRDHLESQGQTVEAAVDAYLGMCKTMLVEQLKFARSGRYSTELAADAYENIYSSDEHMLAYMYGLALSQFLWANHYQMYKFYDCFIAAKADVRRYLEIGAGHGLHLLHALKAWPDADATVVDISPTSIRICEDLVARQTSSTACNFVVQDVLEYKGGPFDCIVIGEVLEHVDDPLSIIKKLHGLLSNSGRLFVTTCARCPAVDHVYLYQDVDDIEDQLAEGGFKVEQHLVLPIQNLPKSADGDDRPGLNYAAVCVKGDA